MGQVKPAAGLSERLGALEVLDLSGDSTLVGGLWAEYPLLLVHLRHFG